MQMKTSMYNWLAKDDQSDNYVMYNGYTGAIIEICTPDDIDLMKRVVSIGDNKECGTLYDDISEREKDVLEKCGLVIEDNRHELHELKVALLELCCLSSPWIFLNPSSHEPKSRARFSTQSFDWAFHQEVSPVVLLPSSSTT